MALSLQLELFLAQRLLELEDEADVVAMSQLQVAPPVLQGQSSHRVRAQLATTRELLAQLCSRSVQHLCMILASPRSVGVSQTGPKSVLKMIPKIALNPAPK